MGGSQGILASRAVAGSSIGRNYLGHIRNDLLDHGLGLCLGQISLRFRIEERIRILRGDRVGVCQIVGEGQLEHRVIDSRLRFLGWACWKKIVRAMTGSVS